MKPPTPTIVILSGFLLLQGLSCDKNTSGPTTTESVKPTQVITSNPQPEEQKKFCSKFYEILEQSRKGSYLIPKIGNMIHAFKDNGYEIDFTVADSPTMIGTIKWKDRTLPAGINRGDYFLINRAKGEKKQIKLIFAGAYDEEYEIWREVIFLANEQDFEKDIKFWKSNESFIETNMGPWAEYYYGGQVR